MNIFKSFELFWSLPQKLFSNKVFKVTHIEAPSSEASIQADVSDKSICLNVYNSPKVYNLLSGMLYKKKMLNENKNSKIYNKRTIA